jgi:hypothetical protein
LCIEDLFDPVINVAKSLVNETFASIKLEILRACTLLTKTGDFDKVCEPECPPVQYVYFPGPGLRSDKIMSSHWQEKQYKNDNMLPESMQHQNNHEHVPGTSLGEDTASSAHMEYGPLDLKEQTEQCGLIVKNVKLCRFFKRNCRNGNRCKYGHVLPELVPASISHEKMKVREQ